MSFLYLNTLIYLGAYFTYPSYHEKHYQFGGVPALLLLLMLWLPATGWAQLTLGNNLSGPTQASVGRPVEYTHTYTGENYFWHVRGAAMMNGQPAAAWPSGIVPDEGRRLTVAWDSVDVGVLELRQGNPEASEVVAELTVAVRLGGCDGRIFYNGQGSASLGWNITGDAYLCPTTAQNPQLHKFEFNRTCIGNVNVTSPGGFRPRYIWTVKYRTAAGTDYQEQWQNPQNGPKQAEILLRLYDVVPAFPYQAINSNYIPWNYSPIGPPLPNLNAGQPIVSARIEVTGYSCGNVLLLPLCGQVEKTITVYYQPPTPDPVGVSGSGARCRTQPYTVSVPGVPQATRYAWSATNGARITGAGSTATLDVSQVPPGTNQTVVRAVAWNDNAPCRKNSDPSPPVTVNLVAAAPAPQRLLLTGGLCPSTDSKLLQVDPVVGATGYLWTLTGAGTQVNLLQTPGPTVSIPLTQPGQVTVTVQAVTACGGPGLPTTLTFTIGDTPQSAMPACPSSLSGGFLCDGRFRLSVPAPAFGFSYVFQVNSIQPSTRRVVATNSNGPGFLDYEFPDGPPSSFEVEVAIFGCNRFRGCQVYTVVPVQIFCRGTQAGTLGASQPNEAELSPNPTTGEVNISSASGQLYSEVQVLSAQGQVLLTRKATGNDGAVKQLNLRALPAGIYLLRLYDGRMWSSQRLVKQ